MNNITEINKYPLLLEMELVDIFVNTDHSTKLDIRRTSVNLRVAEGRKDKLAFKFRAEQFSPMTMLFKPTGAPG